MKDYMPKGKIWMCSSTNLRRCKNDIYDTLWSMKRSEFPEGNSIKDLVHNITVIIMGGYYGWTPIVGIAISTMTITVVVIISMKTTYWEIDNVKIN